MLIHRIMCVCFSVIFFLNITGCSATVQRQGENSTTDAKVGEVKNDESAGEKDSQNIVLKVVGFTALMVVVVAIYYPAIIIGIGCVVTDSKDFCDSMFKKKGSADQKEKQEDQEEKQKEEAKEEKK